MAADPHLGGPVRQSAHLSQEISEARRYQWLIRSRPTANRGLRAPNRRNRALPHPAHWPCQQLLSRGREKPHKTYFTSQTNKQTKLNSVLDPTLKHRLTHAPHLQAQAYTCSRWSCRNFVLSTPGGWFGESLTSASEVAISTRNCKTLTWKEAEDQSIQTANARVWPWHSISGHRPSVSDSTRDALEGRGRYSPPSKAPRICPAGVFLTASTSQWHL